MISKSKVFIYIICIALFLITIPAHSGDLDKEYSPTRKEWLEMNIFKMIKIRTDVWKQKIGFLIGVNEKDNTVYITLSSANDQTPLKEESKQEYVKTIKKDIELLLQDYEWSKYLKVFVQFI